MFRRFYSKKVIISALAVAVLSAMFGVSDASAQVGQKNYWRMPPAIGRNAPTKGWVTFDFFPGRRGEAVSYHNGASVGAVFRIREKGNLIQEYKLDFPFAERMIEQRAADIFMVQNCLAEFRRASEVDGGMFFIQASIDPAIGLVCSSQVQ